MAELPGCLECNASLDCDDCSLQEGCLHHESGCQNIANCEYRTTCESRIKKEYWWGGAELKTPKLMPGKPMVIEEVPEHVKDTDITEDVKTKFTGLADSGSHRDFETGSRRDSSTGKGRPDLLCIFALNRDMVHYENGAVKYADRNWELGQRSSVYYCSAFRHMLAYMEGKRDEDHLAAVRWNIGGIMYNEEMVRRGIYSSDMLDTPDYTSILGWEATIKNPALEENARRKAEQDAKAKA